jgi:hypothetical protein
VNDSPSMIGRSSPSRLRLGPSWQTTRLDSRLLRTPSHRRLRLTPAASPLASLRSGPLDSADSRKRPRARGAPHGRPGKKPPLRQRARTRRLMSCLSRRRPRSRRRPPEPVQMPARRTSRWSPRRQLPGLRRRFRLHARDPSMTLAQTPESVPFEHRGRGFRQTTPSPQPLASTGRHRLPPEERTTRWPTSTRPFRRSARS